LFTVVWLYRVTPHAVVQSASEQRGGFKSLTAHAAHPDFLTFGVVAVVCCLAAFFFGVALGGICCPRARWGWGVDVLGNFFRPVATAFVATEEEEEEEGGGGGNKSNPSLRVFFEDALSGMILAAMAPQVAKC
jgi:hypothetical protein